MRALLDNSVISLAEILFPISIETPGMVNRLALLECKPRPSGSFKASELEALPSLSNAMKENKIEAFTSKFLMFESFGRPHSAIKIENTSLLDGVRFQNIAPAVDFGKFFSVDYEEIDNVLKLFVKLVIEGKFVRSALDDALLRNMTEYELRHLDNPTLLENICSSLHWNHYTDAYHYWTAAASGLDLFITTDKKFLNALSQNKGLGQIQCKAVTPRQALALIDFPCATRMPWEYGKRYLIGGMPYR